MAVLTKPQRTLLMWAYKRRNPFKLTDAAAGLAYQPKHLSHLTRCIESLTPAFIEKEERDAAGTTPGGELVYSLTDLASEIAGNIKAALADAQKT